MTFGLPRTVPLGPAAPLYSLFTACDAGKLSVVSLTKAESDTASAVTATGTAGCWPARPIVSADQEALWVTASASKALLGPAGSADRCHSIGRMRKPR